MSSPEPEPVEPSGLDSSSTEKMATTIGIDVPISNDDDTDCSKISSFEVAASYNWLDEYTPTILVPGH